MRHAAGGEHARLRLVEHLTAEQTGIDLADTRTLRSGDELLVTTPAGERERHAPDVPRRCRVGCVEVAVRVEPREPEPDPRARAADAGHRAGVSGAVAAQREQHRAAVALYETRLHVAREPTEIGGDQVAVLRTTVGIRDPARIVGGVAMIEPGRPGQAGTSGEAVAHADVAQQRWTALHPCEVSAEGSRGADDHDGSLGHDVQHTHARETRRRR